MANPQDKVIYLATTNQEVLNSLVEKFPDHTIMVGDKILYNKIVNHYQQLAIKWKEKQTIEECRKDVKIIEEVTIFCSNLKDIFGRNWFSKKDLVQKANFSYKEASRAIKLLYVFGFIAVNNKNEDLDTPGNSFLIISDSNEKLEYLRNLRRQKEEEINQINSFIEQIAMDINNDLKKGKEEGEVIDNPNLKKEKGTDEIGKSEDNDNNIEGLSTDIEKS